MLNPFWLLFVSDQIAETLNLMTDHKDQLGCMGGALLNLWVGDRLGRIKTLYVYVFASSRFHKY
jgi:hypothetical protein